MLISYKIPHGKIHLLYNMRSISKHIPGSCFTLFCCGLVPSDFTHTFTVTSHLFNVALRWRHNVRDSVSNHQPHDCLLNRLFRRRSKKTSKLRVTGLCAGNSPGTGEFPAQMASYAENVSIWWRNHANSALFLPSNPVLSFSIHIILMDLISPVSMK